MIRQYAALMVASTSLNPVVDAPSGTIEGRMESRIKNISGYSLPAALRRYANLR